MLKGSCMCGQVQYEYTGEMTEVAFCHCLQCRKAQGTPFVSNAPLAKDKFTITHGQDVLKHYESSPGKHRFFCSHCGSPIYSHLASLPHVIRLRIGTLETPINITAPSYHIYVADKASWWHIQDDAPQYIRSKVN